MSRTSGYFTDFRDVLEFQCQILSLLQIFWLSLLKFSLHCGSLRYFYLFFVPLKPPSFLEAAYDPGVLAGGQTFARPRCICVKQQSKVTAPKLQTLKPTGRRKETKIVLARFSHLFF